MDADHPSTGVRIARRSTLSRLPEDLGQASDRNGTGIDDVGERGGPQESDSCDRWDPAFMRRISGYGEATEFFGGFQGVGRA